MIHFKYIWLLYAGEFVLKKGNKIRSLSYLHFESTAEVMVVVRSSTRRPTLTQHDLLFFSKASDISPLVLWSSSFLLQMVSSSMHRSLLQTFFLCSMRSQSKCSTIGCRQGLSDCCGVRESWVFYCVKVQAKQCYLWTRDHIDFTEQIVLCILPVTTHLTLMTRPFRENYWFFKGQG